MTHTSTEQERELFEAWWEEHGLGGYESQFEAWQAARRAPANKQDHAERNLEMQVAKERAARQAAQVEVAELKGRIARAGVEQRRAVLEAVLQEREECALVAEDRFFGNPGELNHEIAAAIRARK